jgi:pilus assembly protein CpaB
VTRRRRALLLAGLALVLGALAASDVAGREAALRERLGAAVPVVVTRGAVPAGARLTVARLAVREVPARYAPRGAYGAPGQVEGLRAAVALAPGTDVTQTLVHDGRAAAPAGAPVRPGERVAELVARGSAGLIAPGSRVDVLVTRETGDGSGETTLALEDAEVLAAAPAGDGDGAGAAAGSGGGAEGPRVALSLRVSVRQAVFLAAAESFAREVRVLPRAAGDRRHGAAGLRVGSGL